MRIKLGIASFSQAQFPSIDFISIYILTILAPLAVMASHTQSLPHRPTGGTVSDDEAVPDTDPSDTTSLLLERLQAYKHACGYLEAYFTAHEKAEKAHAKEYEKVLKSVSNPLREGQHFDQKLGGIAGLFENIRSNTQGVANAHLEIEKNLKGSVLPILERYAPSLPKVIGYS